MKTRALKNYDSTVGCEVYDIDLNCDDEIIELGKLVAGQCIVYVDQRIDTRRLYNIMKQWGDGSRSPTHQYILDGRLQGRHWREILLHLGLVVHKDLQDMADAVSVVSYKNDDKNRPLGLFTNGELDWHSDQCASDDAQRIIGLQSISDTQNSQTTFLCTHDAFESLSSDMRSMVKELYCRHVWRDGVMAPSLNRTQTILIHYNMVPLDGMETRLYQETCTGLSGIKLPTHSFDGFVGMSREESDRVMTELKKAIYQDKYVYTQNWQDGQIVFMDQEITLHARPTNVLDGDKRTMIRTVTYLNKIFPNHQPASTVRYNGQEYLHEEFAKLVDADRLRYFELEQRGEYTEYDPSH